MSDARTIGRPAPAAARTVEAPINYVAPMAERIRYFANDHSRDNQIIDAHRMPIEDARTAAEAPMLDREGFMLLPHVSAVPDFLDQAECARIHPAEIRALLLELTGADEVVISGPGVLRFGERSPDAGRYNNSYPARFAHIDISDATAEQFAERSRPKAATRGIRRYANYNVWRALSPPPQDVPLTVCDARTLRPQDLILADAVFDNPGQPEWSFEGLVVAYNPAHRWSYFSGMTRDEVLVFKTSDSDPARAHHVPHVAFDDPSCPDGVTPRCSIEMRGIAYWFE